MEMHNYTFHFASEIAGFTGITSVSVLAPDLDYAVVQLDRFFDGEIPVIERTTEDGKAISNV